MTSILYMYIAVTLTYFGVQGVDNELDAVVVIYRHGDRTPVQPYPTDPYRNSSFWPVDFGQLTNTGKLQHLELGKWLRNRYHDFLPPLYSEKDIYIRSTDVDRTLMSAESNLAGLYPPISKQVWDQDIKWQPIPIHTVPEKQDALLSAKKPCPKYNILLKQLYMSDFFKNISHQNHDLYAYLSRYSGQTVSSLETLEYLYNTLMIETIYNYTLPDWATKVFPKKLEPWAFLSFATQAYTTDMARLKTGPLINEIITYFKNVSKKQSDTHKLLVFSAHDTTIANVLNTMGVFEYHAPPYASTILFELRKRSDGSSYINIFYKNSSEPIQLHLKPCDVDCNLDNFIAVLKPVTITLDQWETECSLMWVYNWHLTFRGHLILFGLFLGTMFIIGAVLFGLEKIKKNIASSYIKLPNEEYA